MTQYTHTASHIADYYPFGMEIQRSLGHTQPPAGNLLNNRYLYNSKEYQDDFGLNWYDYGARFYDAQIARWHSVDPLAEYHYNLTPYSYVMNNPIRYIDLFGMDTIPVNDIDWENFDPEVDVILLDEVTVSASRSSNQSSRNQNFGFWLTMEGGGASPTRSTANNWELLRIDLLFLAMGNAKAGRFSKSELYLAEWLKVIKDLWKIKSNKEIKVEGTNEETDAFGRSTVENNEDVNNAKAQKEFRWRQINYLDTLTGRSGSRKIYGYEDSIKQRDTNRNEVWWEHD